MDVRGWRPERGHLLAEAQAAKPGPVSRRHGVREEPLGGGAVRSPGRGGRDGGEVVAAGPDEGPERVDDGPRRRPRRVRLRRDFTLPAKPAGPPRPGGEPHAVPRNLLCAYVESIVPSFNILATLCNFSSLTKGRQSLSSSIEPSIHQGCVSLDSTDASVCSCFEGPAPPCEGQTA